MVQVRFTAGVALVVTLVLSGCGGSSSSDDTTKFKTGYGSVANKLRQISQETGATIQRGSSQTDAQIAAKFRDLATRWQKQLNQLKTLKPPANVAAAFNTVTSAASRAEADFNAIAAAAETHSSSAAKQAGTSLVTDILNAKSASTTITQKLGIT